jgi:hypothetical protein
MKLLALTRAAVGFRFPRSRGVESGSRTWGLDAAEDRSMAVGTARGSSRRPASQDCVFSCTGDPCVARDPSGHVFGRESVPVTGHGCFSGHDSC